MKRLPGGLAAPLHILDPVPGWVWGVVAVGVLLGLWCLYRWRRRRRAPQPARAPAPLPAATGSPFEELIQGLLLRFRESNDYRRACHELAGEMRQHLESRTLSPYTALTAGEVQRRFGDRPLSRLFSLLAELQFGRREPGRGDFEGLCELALEVVPGATKGGEG